MSHGHAEEHNASSNLAFGSHWPDGGVSRPRSATIVITREADGMSGRQGGHAGSHLPHVRADIRFAHQPRDAGSFDLLAQAGV